METNQIKLTEEELKKIEELRIKYMNLTAQFGQLKIEQITLKKQLQRLDELETQFSNEYSSIQTEEETFSKTIFEKYGNGEIDAETGLFTPIATTV